MVDADANGFKILTRLSKSWFKNAKRKVRVSKTVVEVQCIAGSYYSTAVTVANRQLRGVQAGAK